MMNITIFILFDLQGLSDLYDPRGLQMKLYCIKSFSACIFTKDVYLGFVLILLK